MRLFGFEITWARKSTLTLDQLIQRLEAAAATSSGVTVTAETALESPTVQAIVRAIAQRIATLPVHVFLKTMSQFP